MSNILIKDGKVVGGLPISVENMTLLWENPNPTSEFASQTITLSSGDYDLCLAIMQNYITSPNNISVVFEKGKNGYANYSSTSSSTNISSFARQLGYVDDTHLVVNDCYMQTQGSSRTTNNSYVIPYKIYGIKKNGVAKNVSTKASDCYLNNGKSVENSLSNTSDSPLINFSSSISKIGNICVLYFNQPLNAMTKDVSYNAGTLAEEYRPCYQFLQRIIGNGRPFDITITTTGEVSLTCRDTLPSTGIPVIGSSISYITN